MTEKDQQKVVRPGTFKKGFDERRWLKGRPRVPKDAKKLMDNLFWEIMSEEVTTTTGEKVDRLRAMIRGMTSSKQSSDKQAVLDRLFGKVAQGIELAGKDGGELTINIRKASEIDGSKP